MGENLFVTKHFSLKKKAKAPQNIPGYQSMSVSKAYFHFCELSPSFFILVLLLQFYILIFNFSGILNPFDYYTCYFSFNYLHVF